MPHYQNIAARKWRQQKKNFAPLTEKGKRKWGRVFIKTVLQFKKVSEKQQCLKEFTCKAVVCSLHDGLFFISAARWRWQIIIWISDPHSSSYHLNVLIVALTKHVLMLFHLEDRLLSPMPPFPPKNTPVTVINCLTQCINKIISKVDSF